MPGVAAIGEEAVEEPKESEESVEPSIEADRRNLNHILFRSWCGICKARRGQEVAHYSKDNADNRTPILE